MITTISAPIVDEKTGETHTWVNPNWLGHLLGNLSIDTFSFKLYGSQEKTYELALKDLRDRGKLIRCYHYLTDDNRLALPLNACRNVVLYEVIRAWYEVSGIEVPAKVTQQMEAAMAKAKATTADAEQEEGATATKTKEPRVTNKSIIEAGLLAGKDEATIMAEVKAHFPDGKADSKHVGYYRHYLVKEGKLAAQPRKSRAKAAEEAAPEPKEVAAPKGKAAAAPVKAAASKTPAKAPPTKAKAGR